MILRKNLLPVDAQPACAKPEHLPMVDAAFDDPHSDQAHRMAVLLCAHCPVAETCLTQAMTQPEHGTWGATSAYRRTAAGAPANAELRRAAVRMTSAETSRRYRAHERGDHSLCDECDAIRYGRAS